MLMIVVLLFVIFFKAQKIVACHFRLILMESNNSFKFQTKYLNFLTDSISKILGDLTCL